MPMSILCPSSPPSCVYFISNELCHLQDAWNVLRTKAGVHVTHVYTLSVRRLPAVGPPLPPYCISHTPVNYRPHFQETSTKCSFTNTTTRSGHTDQHGFLFILRFTPERILFFSPLFLTNWLAESAGSCSVTPGWRSPPYTIYSAWSGLLPLLHICPFNVPDILSASIAYFQ